MNTKKRFMLAIMLLLSVTLLSSCGKTEEPESHESMHSDRQIDSTLVRDYSVNVASLDENKDGNIFQCPMDWNVISDDAGSCPLCMMDLEEYSVAEAQKNLEENKPTNQ